jgi:hypothetical protein
MQIEGCKANQSAIEQPGSLMEQNDFKLPTDFDPAIDSQILSSTFDSS